MAEIKDVLNALSQSPLGKAKHISGIKDGEKALLVALKGRSVVLSSDFVEAVKLKRNLTSLAEKLELKTTTTLQHLQAAWQILFRTN